MNTKKKQLNEYRSPIIFINNFAQNFRIRFAAFEKRGNVAFGNLY